MYHSKHSRIGSDSEPFYGKGISGGEMKRLAIASELLRDSDFLLADEPTSALDSALAEDVVSILKDVAVATRRCCLSTIHQPSSDIYRAFDDLCLLCGGHVVYLGTRENAVPYFAQLGFPVPLQEVQNTLSKTSVSGGITYLSLRKG